jgi:hypothetical protein
MELRHMRYFVAVADAGSLTVAAVQKLHTSQPSLSLEVAGRVADMAHHAALGTGQFDRFYRALERLDTVLADERQAFAHLGAQHDVLILRDRAGGGFGVDIFDVDGLADWKTGRPMTEMLTKE